eukprot:11884940-Alexandrium_andersonii.AAC.1
MSASLVGSEMCIRDRARVHCRRTALRKFAARALAPATSSAAASGHKPVSYTHLTLPTICSV